LQKSRKISKFFKRVIGWSFRSIGIFFGLLFLYALMVIILGIIPVNLNVENEEGSIPIYVSTNGIHSDFILPTEYLPFDLNTFSLENKSAQNAQFVAFGWGDKGFYLEVPTWDKIRFQIVFDALFFRSTTAMHVTFFSDLPQESEFCKKLLINDKQVQILIHYITESFEKDTQNQLQILEGKGYGRRDEFYEATGTYSFLKTCNVWTNTGLQKMGIRTAVWSPFDKALFWHLEKN